MRTHWTGIRAIAASLIALSAALPALAAQSARQGPLKESLDMESAVALAEKANPDLRNAAIALRGAVRDYEARYAAYLPSLSASASLGAGGNVFLDPGTGRPRETDPTSMNFRLGMSLPLGSDLPYDLRQKGIDLESQRIDMENARLAVRRDTRKAVLALIKAGEDVELRARAIRAANETLARTKTKYELGAASEQSYLEAALKASTLGPSLLQAQADRRRLMVSLARVLGFSGDVELEIAGSLKELQGPVEPDRGSSAGDSLASHPQMRKSEISLSSLRNNLEKARRAFFPSFSASLSWSTNVSPVFDPASWAGMADNGSLSLGLSLPIDSWMPNSRSKLSLEKVRDSLELAELKRAGALQSLRDSLAQVLSDLELHAATMESNGLSIDQAKRSLEWVRESWNRGQASMKTLEDAEEALFNAETNLIASRYKYLSSLCDLAYLVER